MRPHNILNIAFLVLFIAAFSACKKVINVNLNSSSPRYVVQGNVTDVPGVYTVTISRTINFNQDNVFPGVSGATVVITDITAGAIDTLTETLPGNYTTHTLAGTPGHTYKLYVNAANNIFIASSTMPALVTLDSLYAQPSAFGGKRLQLVPLYTDPPLLGVNYHYYHFMEYKNDTASASIIVRNDALINGKIINQPIGGDGITTGDSIAVYLECIDSGIYQYYSTLEQTNNQNSATPANPLTNLTGGALGYFSAHTSSYKSLIVH